jgi:hypothetical protein
MDEALGSISCVRRWPWPNIAILASVASIGLGLTACGPNSTAPARPASAGAAAPAIPTSPVAVTERRGPLALTTAQLAGTYAQGEADAQSKYGGRQLHVTGIVLAVTPDEVDGPKVRLSHDVLATLTDKQAAASLSTGTIITLVCEDVSKAPSGPSLKTCVVKPPLSFGK